MEQPQASYDHIVIGVMLIAYIIAGVYSWKKIKRRIVERQESRTVPAMLAASVVAVSVTLNSAIPINFFAAVFVDRREEGNGVFILKALMVAVLYMLMARYANVFLDKNKNACAILLALLPFLFYGRGL